MNYNKSNKLNKTLFIVLGSIIGVLGLIIGGIVFFVAIFFLVNFPFIFMHSETKITEEDKTIIEQYVIDTFGEELELVRYDRFSSTSGEKRKFAIYKVNNREFEVGLSSGPNKEWVLYDTFVNDYILGKDEDLIKQIPKLLKDKDTEYSAGHGEIRYYVIKEDDNEKYQNTILRLNDYKKDIKSLTREEILLKEKDNIEVSYWVVISPKEKMTDFEDAIYDLYEIMKSSEMGEIGILVEFGTGNYQTGIFDFHEESDYNVSSKEDLKKFYDIKQ